MCELQLPFRLLSIGGACLFLLSVGLGSVSAQSGTPGAPVLDSVSAGDRALHAAWSEPSDTGSSTIATFDLRYILTTGDETDDANWTEVEGVWPGAGELAHAVIDLSNGDQYDVQVRAVNSRGDGAWSATVTGTPADHGGNRSSATAFTLQSPMLGYIASSSDDDYFAFTLDDDTGIFIFTTSYISGFLATTGDLRNSSGTVIRPDEATPDFREHGDQLLIWDSLAAGTYYVRVEAPEAGYYTLHAQPVPDSASTGDAIGMNLGGRANGILEPGSGDEDYFSFVLSSATDVMVWLPRAGNGLDPLGTLLDAEGAEVAGHDDSFIDGDRGRHFIIREELDAGVYFLKVSGAPSTTFDVCKGYRPVDIRQRWENCYDTEEKPAATDSGPYTVVVEAVPPRSSSLSSSAALHLGDGQLAGGRIDTRGDSDYFSITVDQPTHVKVDVVSAEVETEMRFYGTDGAIAQRFAVDTDYLPGAFKYRLHATLEAGTSHVKVAAETRDITGPFAIRATVDREYADFLSTCTGLATSYSDPLYGCQWNMNNTGQDTGQGAGTPGEDINVEEVWDGGNLGEGINIAIVDDSLHFEHEDLRDNVNTDKNINFTQYGNIAERHFYHGTSMAGIIAARDNAFGMRGVAPRATIYGYNFLRNSTFENMSRSMRGHMNTTSVSNNSWGFKPGPGLNRPPRIWEVAIQTGVNRGLRGRGVSYVFSAGNGALKGGYSNLSGLTNHYAVMAACSVNDQGEWPDYSEQGPNLWICAPAGDASAGRQGVVSTDTYNRYTQGSAGSAAATATVTGVTALVRKANPALTWRDVKLVLAGSARKNAAGDSGWTSGALKYGSSTERYNFNHKYGFGVVDAKAAVDLAESWTNLPRMRVAIGGSVTDLDLTIPDGGTVSHNITVGPGVGFIEFVEVHIATRHPSFRDLKVELTSPDGSTSVLSVSHDSESKFPLNGSFRFGSAAHLGEGAGGQWTLRLVDEVTGNSGLLKSWRLTVYGHVSGDEVPIVSSITSNNAELVVGWTAVGDHSVTAYDVRYIDSAATDKADANWTVVDDAVTAGTGTLTYTISGLTNGAQYDVQVRAVRGATDGAWSGTAVGTPMAGSAAVPAIQDIRTEDTALNVTWNAPSSPPALTTAYDVRHIRSDASDKADANWTLIDDAWTEGALSYTITGLANYAEYDVQVRAVSANGDGAWSSTATGQPAEFGDSVETAGTLLLNSLVRGVINVVGDLDAFKVELSTAGHYSFYTTGSTNTIGVLLDDQREEIDQNDNGLLSRFDTNFYIAAALDPGTYYLLVSGYGNETGKYALRAEASPDSSSRSDAVPLPIDGTAEETFSGESDEDFFKLQLTQRTDVALRSTGNRDTVAVLTNSSGTEIASSDEGYMDPSWHNFLILKRLSPGTYYLQIHEHGGRSGPYRVHASSITEPGNTSTDAQEIRFGELTGGRISSGGETEFFTFTLEERRRVRLAATGQPFQGSSLQVVAELLDGNLNSLERFWAHAYTGLLEGERVLPAGEYFLKIRGATSTEKGVYVLRAYRTAVSARESNPCSGDLIGLSDTFAGCQWHLINVAQLGGLGGPDLNIESVWSTYDGEGINVVVVDDGLEFGHEDLTANVDRAKNHSYVEGKSVSDLNPWHGTSVAGVIAAEANDIGVRGVAPGATIYGHNLLHNVTDMNLGYAMSHDLATTAISNNSWGTPDFGLPSPANHFWRAGVESGITSGYGGKGVFYAWAAGNGAYYRDYSSLDEQTNFYGVTAVCAVNYRGKRSSFSEPGSNLWVCGLSNNGATSGLPGITTTAVRNDYTSRFGGTSSATPMVAGVAALMREANDQLTWRDIKLILAATARKVDPDNTGWTEGALKYGSMSERYSFNYEYGFGLVDAQAAVDTALTWTNAPAFRKISVSSGGLDLHIADTQGGVYATTVTTSLTVDPHVSFIEHVQVDVDLQHTSFRDLHIEVESPSGVVSVLSPTALDAIGTSLTALGERWNGEFSFGSAKHLGENGAGEWTLRISDRVRNDSGTLRSWGITLYGHGEGPGIPAIDAVTAGARSATVAWSAPTITGNAAITSYDLRYRREEPDAEWVELLTIWSSGTLSYTLSGLDGEATYDIQVRARSGTVVGPWSKAEAAEPTLATPTAPSIIAVDPGNRTLGVTWTPPPEAVGDEITAYDLRYILTSADESVDANWTVRSRVWTSGPLRYAQGSLTNGSGYDVQVRAVNSEGEGAWSSSLQGTPADRVNLRLGWASAATTVDENAGSVTLQAELVVAESGMVESGLSVDVAVTADGAANAPSDYTVQPTALTFSASDFTSATIQGQTRYIAVKDIVLALVDDSVNEGDEQVTLTLTYDEPALPHLVGDRATLAVTIRDDDRGPIALSWENPSVTVDEGAGVVALRALAITGQDVAPAADFTVQASVAAVEGTAERSVDYSPHSSTIVFSGSSFSRTTIDGQGRYRAAYDVVIPIADDLDDEPDEQLTVVMAFVNPTLPHLQGSSATATVTIRDNDFVPVTIGWDPPAASLEEHGPTVTLGATVTTTVDRMPESGFSVLLSATTADDTATAGSDYRSLTQDLSFQQSDFTRTDVGGQFRFQATKDVTVSIIDDTVDEGDEAFTVDLAYRGVMHNHYTGGSAEATVTIVDNELPEVTLGWEAATLSVDEPATPGSTVAVTLTAVASTVENMPPEPGFTLDYSVTTADGTATATADYEALHETKSIPRSDFTAETVDGQTRYRTTLSYTVTIADDTVDEEDETFTVRLAFDDPNAPYLIPGDMTATITIADNDHVAVRLGWAETRFTAEEPTTVGDTTSLTLTARAVTTKDKQPEAGFVMNFSVSSADGTAQEPADYTGVFSGSESFTPNDFSRTTLNGQRVFVAARDFTVTIAHDTRDEPNETFTVDLDLTNASLPHLSAGATRATITITDNDHVPVALSWAQSSFTENEDTAAVTLTAEVTTTVDKMPEAGFVAAVAVETVDGSATAGPDYVRLSTAHSFPQSAFSRVDTGGGLYRYQATRAFTVSLREDNADEETEQFQVVLAYNNPALPHLTGGSATATIAITDNDHVPVRLGWTETQFTVEEPTTVGDTTPLTLTAQAVTTKDKRPESGFTFDIAVSTADGTAREPGDYEKLTETETIDRFDFSRQSVGGQFRWVAEASFTVNVNHDTITQETETFQVHLAYAGSSQPYQLRADTTATVTVTDDAASLADLTTTVTVDRGTATFGDTLTYEWSVTNTDAADTTNVRLNATLDPGVTFTSAGVDPPSTGQCSQSGGTVTCTLGTLSQSDRVDGAIVVEVADSASADIAFRALAKGDQLDRTPGDNDDAVATELVAPPRAIADLRATGEGGHIDLAWSAPVDNGSPITAYTLERKDDVNDFVALTAPDPNARSYRDEGVVRGTEYTYRIRAANADGTAAWSNEATGETRVIPLPVSGGGGGGGGGGFGPAPKAPKFADGFRTTRTLPENARPGAAVGAPIPASHVDDLAITYALSGADAASFTVDVGTGQMRVKEGVELELGRTYTVNLTATDAAGFGAVIIVVIEVSGAAHHAYDLNANGVIDRVEVIAAVRDYFQGLIDKRDVVEIIKLYFAG